MFSCLIVSHVMGVASLVPKRKGGGEKDLVLQHWSPICEKRVGTTKIALLPATQLPDSIIQNKRKGLVVCILTPPGQCDGSHIGESIIESCRNACHRPHSL